LQQNTRKGRKIERGDIKYNTENIKLFEEKNVV